MNYGGIIYITGLLGAGKSTLIHAALREITELRQMPVYITRELRDYESDPRLEITHVNHEEYEELRSQAEIWDHTEILGNWYGADVSAIRADQRKGQWFIISSPIEVDKLDEMQSLYCEIGSSTVIYIDTDLATANKRLLLRDGDRANERINDRTQNIELAAQAKDRANIIFSPKGNQMEDERLFVKLIQSIMA